jgi:hypothetical protein
MNGDDRTVLEEPADEGRVTGDTRLDGNAAAGILSEIFVSDVTAARTTCASCGAVRALGALLVYGYAMGTVMRCPDCDAVVLRVARIRNHVCLDPRGASLLVITASSVGQPVA